MLTTLLAAIEPTPGTLDVLEKVHGFYKDAWDQLMDVHRLGFGVVAVIVPAFVLIVLALLERRREASFRLDTERVMTEIQNARREMSEALEATRDEVEKGRKAFADDQNKATQKLNALDVRLRKLWMNVCWQSGHDRGRRGDLGGAIGFICDGLQVGLEGEILGEQPMERQLEWVISMAASGKVALAEWPRRSVRGAIDALENSGMGGKYEECANALKRLLEEAPPSEDHEAEDESEDDSSTV